MIDFIGANKALQYKEGPTIYPIQTISHTSILIMSLQEQCSSTRSNLLLIVGKRQERLAATCSNGNLSNNLRPLHQGKIHP